MISGGKRCRLWEIGLIGIVHFQNGALSSRPGYPDNAEVRALAAKAGFGEPWAGLAQILGPTSFRYFVAEEPK